MSTAQSARVAARRQHDRTMRVTRTGGLDHLGAGAQKSTIEALHQLPEEKWIVFHDLRLPSGHTLDHVVVGPPGVFVIDRLEWSGTVMVKGNVLRRRGLRANRALSHAARDARMLVELVPALSEELVWPTLCISSEEAVMGCAHEVLVTSPETVAWALAGCPKVLSVVEIDRMAWELETSLDDRSELTDPEGNTLSAAPVAHREPRSLVRGTGGVVGAFTLVTASVMMVGNPSLVTDVLRALLATG